MKFIHTADWHIGNLFHEFDRTHEHQQFFNFLIETLVTQQTDVLLISGDIYDVANPSAAAMRLFNSFLQQAMEVNPRLQIIVIAGNHDSPSRLEVVKPLLHPDVHIIGLVERSSDGSINYEKLIVPITHNGIVAGYCLAAPFLRLGDYPALAECSSPYSEGISAFYHEMYETAERKCISDEFIIALGHLHAQRAEISEQDTNERAIMGGVETIPVDAFPAELAYVALGHIHKAQRVSAKEHIRYSGSPLPMSFSEINYKHQVIGFEIQHGKAINIEAIEVPAFTRLLQVPAKHSPIGKVVEELSQLSSAETDPANFPYLQVRVLLEGPEPGLRHQVEQALKGKSVRLAKIDVRYPDSSAVTSGSLFSAQDHLQEMKPFDIFSLMYKSKYNADIPDSIGKLFHQVEEQVNQQEQ